MACVTVNCFWLKQHLDFTYQPPAPTGCLVTEHFYWPSAASWEYGVDTTSIVVHFSTVCGARLNYDRNLCLYYGILYSHTSIAPLYALT